MFKVILTFIIIYISIVSSFTFTASNNHIITTQLNAKSRALPFLESPAKLDGTLIGDFGFDPLGFTDTLQTLNYVQAAELKHSRVSMLAVVGFIIQQKFHFLTTEADPFKAIAAIGYGPNLQILSFIGVIELATWDKTFKGETPGDLGFDPLNISKGKSAAVVNSYKLKEIKNGRLAMIAIIGLFAQNLYTGGLPTF